MRCFLSNILSVNFKWKKRVKWHFQTTTMATTTTTTTTKTTTTTIDTIMTIARQEIKSTRTHKLRMECDTQGTKSGDVCETRDREKETGSGWHYYSNQEAWSIVTNTLQVGRQDARELFCCCCLFIFFLPFLLLHHHNILCRMTKITTASQNFETTIPRFSRGLCTLCGYLFFFLPGFVYVDSLLSITQSMFFFFNRIATNRTNKHWNAWLPF